MFDKSVLQKYLENGYIRVQKHQEHELYIYNYTAKTQYESLWDDVTLNCRGLILNKDDELIARPFKKFFNLGEKENQIIPNEPFEIYEKLDGSLGILYWINNKAFISTRGSFNSNQAIRATNILYKKYPNIINKLDRNLTYLFEIIYPENRIVVDYGEREDIILIGMIDKMSGEELNLIDIGFPIVKKIEGANSINELKNKSEVNKEGFVVKFKNGLRYKVKFEEYLRIHRIVTNVSNISIWEYLKSKNNFDEILERVPDEFYLWVEKTKNNLIEDYNKIEEQCKLDFKTLNSRKDTALYFMKCKYPNILFKMFDNKDYSSEIWKYIRPNYSKPFNKEID